MLAVANIFFFLLHTVLIAFNVFGWIPPRTRKWNLLTLSLTAFSWGVMGLWRGMGYCILTDWHWQIRQAMGIHETSSSYLVLMVRNISGWNPPVSLVNTVALWVFLVSFAASISLNVRDFLATRRLEETT